MDRRTIQTCADRTAGVQRAPKGADPQGEMKPAPTDSKQSAQPSGATDAQGGQAPSISPAMPGVRLPRPPSAGWMLNLSPLN